MLSLKCSDITDIETRKKPKSKEKLKLKFAINKNKQKVSHLLKILIYDNFSEKCHVTFKNFLSLLWTFLLYLYVCQVSSQLIAVLYPKKKIGALFIRL